MQETRPCGFGLIHLCGGSDTGYGQPLDGSPPEFKKHVLSNDFISEGVAVGDVNKDGFPDILAGPCWFEAPDWKRHEIAAAGGFQCTTQYSHSFLDYSMDVNLDGWTDLIVIDFPGHQRRLV